MEPVRPLINFPPSIWGDRFQSFSLDNSELEAYATTIEEYKEQLRRIIIDTTVNFNEKLSLIYSVYRLGLTYLFHEEIDSQLDKLFKAPKDYNEVDLHTISVHFQVFRNYGYEMSCDVFNKFKDCSLGAFHKDITDDVRGMLSFYESTQLRTRGESILDEAFAFTKTQLNSVAKSLQGNLARQVKHALERPFHRGMPMVEARLYMVNYEEECSKYDFLLDLAKVHFKYLQLLQKEELRIVSKWWKDMNFQVITPYVRDRIHELYVWGLTLCLEPYYSQARITTTKILAIMLVLDDTYDAYATIEEMRLLTQALNRWEISAMETLPEYMKPIYKVILDEYAGLHKQLAQEGKAYLVDASKQALQEVSRAYLQEAEWRYNTGEVPSFEEYVKVGSVTTCQELFSKSALTGMGKVANEKALAWYNNRPKILTDSELISRLHDDVMTYKFERERADSVTAVDAYMKSFGVPENVAVDKISEMVENAWKDINEEWLKPREVSMDLLSVTVNLSRVIDAIYRYNDAFTFQDTIFKDYITLLFVDSVPK